MQEFIAVTIMVMGSEPFAIENSNFKEGFKPFTSLQECEAKIIEKFSAQSKQDLQNPSLSNPNTDGRLQLKASPTNGRMYLYMRNGDQWLASTCMER